MLRRLQYTNGNILTSVYNWTLSTHLVYDYQYNDSSQLTSYDGNGLTYDGNGNLTSYNGSTDSWDGKNLSGITNANSQIAYQYNDKGIRTSKTVNGKTTTYTLDNKYNVASETTGTDTMTFVYDMYNCLAAMTFNGTTYSYEKDAQGDVVGLFDSSNNEVVNYSYDSWGKLISIGGSLADTRGQANPFRYRSYYYDTESQLYYLQSRYYDPATSRMLSEDTYTGNVKVPLSQNLYTYCKNNPILYVDRTGHSPMIYDCDDHYIFVADDPYVNSLRASYGLIPFVGWWIHDKIWEFGGFAFIDKDDMVARAKSNISLTMDTLSLTEKVGNIESIGTNLAKYLKTIGKAADIVGKALTALDVINEAFIQKEWEKNELVEIIFDRELVSTTKSGVTDKYIVALSIVNQMVDDGTITYESNGSLLTAYSYTDNEIMESARKVIIDIDKADNYVY